MVKLRLPEMYTGCLIDMLPYSNRLGLLKRLGCQSGQSKRANLDSAPVTGYVATQLRRLVTSLSRRTGETLELKVETTHMLYIQHNF